MLGIGEKLRDLPHEFKGSLPQPLTGAAAFCNGCLVVEGPKFESFQDFSHLLNHADFAKWPLLILVDDLKKTTKSIPAFLWTVFTRFEPASDIHSKGQKIHRHHISYSGPLLIDARMKPSYPKEVVCDEETAERVTKNWSSYFPEGMEMGDSIEANVC